MKRVPWPRTALLVLIAALAPVTASAAGGFTPAERAEIVQIVREALKQDPSILRDAVAAMQAESTRAAIDAVRDKLVTPADAFVGNPKADVTIVEFFDTRCPYCRAMEPTMENFIATRPDVRLVYKDMPVLGPASVLGSKALLAAQHQGAYAQMRKAVMQLPPNTTLEMIHAAADKLGLDWDRLSRDMNSAEVKQRIAENLNLARQLGIDGTPAMVIGDRMIQGAVDPAHLQGAVAGAAKAHAAGQSHTK
jgi:protein-disulfide isomerase